MILLIIIFTLLVAAVIAAVVISQQRPYDVSRPVHPPTESAVLITGGYRGIGKSIAYHLVEKGYYVFVTVRKQNQFDELEKDTPLCPVLLDVTNDQQIAEGVQRVEQICKDQNKTFVAIINNAGMNPEADEYQKKQQKESTEEEIDDVLCDPTIANAVFETNVIGVMRISKAFLPLLLQAKSGARIIHIGSYFGSIAGKAFGLGQAAYESSKFALEGLADNMRRALAGRGIHVSLVKPGNITTDMNPTYGESSAQVVSDAVEHAIASSNPLPRYYPGTIKGYSVRFSCWIFEHLPTSITDKL